MTAQSELIKFDVLLYKKDDVSYESFIEWATKVYPPQAAPVMKKHGIIKWVQVCGHFHIRLFITRCERKSQCCRQMERLGVQSHVMKVLSSICSAQPANTVNMPLSSP
jgi:hypothetical protein